MILIEEVSHSGEILKSVVSKYGAVEDPYEGPSFILPDGQFLDLRSTKNHADVEYYLSTVGLSQYQDFSRRSGSPTLRDIGCIRVDTPKYYIQLPEDNLTSMQYSALEDWIDFLMTCNVPFLEIIAPGSRPVRYDFKDPDIDAGYIVNRIRRYYITDILYEAHKDPFDK